MEREDEYVPFIDLYCPSLAQSPGFVKLATFVCSRRFEWVRRSFACSGWHSASARASADHSNDGDSVDRRRDRAVCHRAPRLVELAGSDSRGAVTCFSPSLNHLALKQALEALFAFLFLVEMALKLLALGYNAYTRSFSNNLDAIFTIIGLAGLIVKWSSSNVRHALGF